MTNGDNVFRPCNEAVSIDEAAMPKNAVLAMAYVPVQRWEKPMGAAEALNRGTAFRSLVKPFWAMEVER